MYIIGNGFDRYHGLPTGYKDFGNFAQKKSNYSYAVKLLGCFYNPKELWSDFEKSLAEPNINALLKGCELDLQRLPLDARFKDAWYNVCQRISSEVQLLFHSGSNLLI